MDDLDYIELMADIDNIQLTLLRAYEKGENNPSEYAFCCGQGAAMLSDFKKKLEAIKEYDKVAEVKPMF